MDEQRTEPDQPAAAPAIFTGEGRAFLRLVFKGAILQIVTLGFYRFWFITDVRRMLWSATSVDGDAFEYTGRGKELLIGFLFAVAILAPCYFLYFLAGLEAVRVNGGSLLLWLTFYLFGQFANYRARRYRLTRTVWRGIRFWMTGSGLNYALRSIGWTLLAIATLGLSLPWGLASLERYKMRNTYFGNLQGRFDGTGRGLFWSGAWVWALGFLLVLVPAGVFIAIGGWTALSRPPVQLKNWPGTLLSLFVYLWLTPFIAIVLWTVFKALEWRWWLAGLRLGAVEFSSESSRRKIFWIYFGFAFTIVIGFLVIIAIVTLFQGPRIQTSSGPNPIFTILLNLAMILAAGILYRYFLQFRLWRAVTASARIKNLLAVSNAVAEGAAASAIGEGLADALDVAGF